MYIPIKTIIYYSSTMEDITLEQRSLYKVFFIYVICFSVFQPIVLVQLSDGSQH